MTFPLLSSAGSTKNKVTTKEHHPDTNTTTPRHQSHLLDKDSSVEQEAERLRSDSEDEDSDNSSDEEEGDDNEEEDNDNKEEDNNIEDITEELHTMSVKAQATIKLPMLMYTWSKDRQELFSVDILLLSGITEDNIDCKIDKNGHYLTVDIFLPEFFLSSRHLQAASEGTISQHHSKTAALDKAIDEFREAFDFETPTLKFKIKLPFKVDGTFVKEVVWYKHDNEILAQEDQFYYMLHIELVTANKPRQVKTAIARRIVDSPIHQDGQTTNQARSVPSSPMQGSYR